MPVTLEKIEEEEIRLDICEKIEDSILKLLNDGKLTLKETIWILGKIQIDVGSALEDKVDPISYEEAFRNYSNNPTIGNALISAGCDMHSWIKL